MADNLFLNTGTGPNKARTLDRGSDVHTQVAQIDIGGSAGEELVTQGTPMPVADSRAEDLLVMLSRIVKILESNAVVDQAQRQRVTLDAISAALTLATVTTVGTVTTVATVTALNNILAIAGMDREQYINIAKQTYASSIRSRLEFV
jgi:hypothetical protein